MSAPSPSRKDLEDLWRERLKLAKLRLDFARNYVLEVEKDFSLAGPSLPEACNPDGRYAYLQALRAENDALTSYRRVLRVYQEVVHDGSIPDEDEWPRSRTGTA